jgi:hypothetical protein
MLGRQSDPVAAAGTAVRDGLRLRGIDVSELQGTLLAIVKG